MNESRSLTESTMEESTLSKSQSRTETLNCTGSKRPKRDREDEGDEFGAKEEDSDVQVWDTLSSSFRQVQSVLDQNRSLIQQVNENHQSKIPDNLAKNVPLINEINGNISKVLAMYSDLSNNFSTIVQQRRGGAASKTDQDGGGSDDDNDTHGEN